MFEQGMKDKPSNLQHALYRLKTRAFLPKYIAALLSDRLRSTGPTCSFLRESGYSYVVEGIKRRWSTESL